MGGFAPREYIEALRPLQDACVPLDADIVRELIKREVWHLSHGGISNGSRRYDDAEAEELLGAVFNLVDPVPLGSASLAQVHCTTLNDGRGTDVAVKVQRPNIDKTVAADLLVLSILSKVVECFYPGAGFEWLIPEFNSTIIAELDFSQEALNAERCRNMLQQSPLTMSAFSWQSLPTAIVPKPMENLTTSKMLTMSFEEGFRVTNTAAMKEHGIDPSKVAAATCSLFAELVHVHGFVHADPHPGNLLVRPRCRPGRPGEFDLVLLDHGMYRRLDEKFRSSYSTLWAGLVSGNDAKALEGICGMGLPEMYFDISTLDIMGLILIYRLPSGVLDSKSSSFGQKLGSLMGKQSRRELKEHFKRKYGDKAFSASTMNDLLSSQPRDLLFCLRTMNLVRGINRELGGTTQDRFVAFGAAASRGDKLGGGGMIVAGDTTARSGVSPAEADAMTLTRISDVLSQAKRSLNTPVRSELLAQRRDRCKKTNAIGRNAGEERVGPLLERGMSDVMESLKISFRVWCQSFFVDLFLLLSGRQVDASSLQLG